MYLLACDFKFYNSMLAKFSSNPWVMMGHGSSVQWVLQVTGQSEWPIVGSAADDERGSLEFNNLFKPTSELKSAKIFVDAGFGRRATQT